MKTVFIPPIVEWNFLKQLPQQIAEQFHKRGYRVIFCGTQQSYFLKREVKENLFVYSSGQHALLDIAEQKIKIDIIYNTWAKNTNYIDILKPDVAIYHSCDSFNEWKSMEPTMLKKADLVFCTSEYLYDLRKNEHDKVFLCRNGCNEEMIGMSEFTSYENLKFVKRPIFCFSGAIGQWISTYLMRKIAERYYTIFAGIEFGKTLPQNIVSYGTLNHENELTNFYRNSDFGILPFDIKQEITLAANPIKLWEYLACGLPVLSTSWIETEISELNDVVFAADTMEQFIEYADEMAMLSQSQLLELRQECFKIARNNTWEKRFQIIQKEIDML